MATFDPDEAGRWPTPRRGTVVSAHPLATQVGVDVLDAGGNAADAAVATALALAVVYPQAGNLGGGGFAIWVAHDAAEPPRTLDFRETAPRALTVQLFLDEEGRFVAERSLAGALAVGVPGSPHGLWRFQKELGVLSFGDVAAPAIRLAREGFPIDAWLARALALETARARLSRDPVAASVFLPGGEPLAEGQLLRQGDLARTLDRLVHGGPDGFYRGAVAGAIVETLRPGGGVLDLRDLADYEPVWREPLRGWFRGLEIVTAPPPSSGGLVFLQVLSLLDGFPLDEEVRRARETAAAMGQEVDASMAGLSGRAVHWWIESMRCAFADHAQHMGDPDLFDVPVAELLSPAWIAERRVSIGELANPDVAPLDLVGFREAGETTHLSVLDREGNAVALTTTLNSSFGCGLMVRGGGFLLNNEIDDFSIVPGVPNDFGLVGGEANAIAPHKRPLSSMTPLVVRDGGQVVRMVLGSPGGPRIITALLQVFLRVEVYGDSLEEAVRAPRLHQQWEPSATRLEPGWDALLVQALENRRHEIVQSADRWAAVQAIWVPVGGEPVGVSDPRRGGAVGAQERPLSEPARPPER